MSSEFIPRINRPNFWGHIKLVGVISLIWKTLLRSNGCTLIKNGYYFVKLRKSPCFCIFMRQRKFSAQTKWPPFRNNCKMSRKTAALATFSQRDTKVRGSSIFASNNISLSTNFRKWEPKGNGSNVFTHCLRDAKIRGSNVITSRNYSPFHAFIDIVRSSLSWMVEKFRSKICKLLIYLRHFTEKWFFAPSTILLGGLSGSTNPGIGTKTRRKMLV